MAALKDLTVLTNKNVGNTIGRINRFLKQNTVVVVGEKRIPFFGLCNNSQQNQIRDSVLVISSKYTSDLILFEGDRYKLMGNQLIIEKFNPKTKKKEVVEFINTNYPEEDALKIKRKGISKAFAYDLFAYGEFDRIKTEMFCGEIVKIIKNELNRQHGKRKVLLGIKKNEIMISIDIDKAFDPYDFEDAIFFYLNGKKSSYYNVVKTICS